MREPAQWGRRTIATVAAVALAVGVGLAVSTAPAPDPPEASRSNDPAATCRDLRGGAMVACLHGNDAPPPGVSLYHRPTLQELEARSSLRSPRPQPTWHGQWKKPTECPIHRATVLTRRSWKSMNDCRTM